VGKGGSGALALALCLAAASPADDGASAARPAALAGLWYPADPGELAALVDRLLGPPVGPDPGATPVRALVVPHAAYRWSGAGAAAGFRRVRGQAPARVVVLAPGHRGAWGGLALPAEGRFATPLGDVPVDRGALERLRGDGLARGDPAAHGPEHAVEVQLPFLQRALAPGWRLVPILVGDLAPGEDRRAADLLRPLLDPATLLVVSGDFTHYGERFGYRPFPPGPDVRARLEALDLGAFELLAARDPAGLLDYAERTRITACALGPLRVLAHLLPQDARTERVSYYTSGDLTGDYRHSVSYLTATVRSAAPLGGGAAADEAGPVSADGLRYLHALASHAVEAAAAPGNGSEQRVTELLEAAPAELRRPAGAFVTLRRGEGLRGCVGSVQAASPLAWAVVEQARNASRRDGRFRPLDPAELAGLRVEVSVLSPLRTIASWQHFVPGRHGVVLAKGGRRAVFLPEVAAQAGWGREETLTRLALKAGLEPDAWRNGAALAVFTTQHFVPDRP
jgi:hypothetical protein